MDLTWWDLAPTMVLEPGVPVRFVFEGPGGRRTHGVMLTADGVAIAPEVNSSQPRLFRPLLDSGFLSRVLPDYETSAGLAFVIRRWFALELDPELLEVPLGAAPRTQRLVRMIRDRNDCGAATDDDRRFMAQTMAAYTTRVDEAVALGRQAWGATARPAEAPAPLPALVAGDGGQE